MVVRDDQRETNLETIHVIHRIRIFFCSSPSGFSSDERIDRKISPYIRRSLFQLRSDRGKNIGPTVQLVDFIVQVACVRVCSRNVSFSAAERKLDLAGTIKPDVLFWPMKEDNTSSITLLYDGNTGRDLDSGVPLPYACPATTASNVSSSWIRLDLRGLFAVSRVRVITRASFANNSQVHVGNSLVENGLSNYQCGSLWVIAPNSNSFRGFPYDFKCQAAQWARYIVVVRNDPGEQLSVCELSVYVMESVASAPGAFTMDNRMLRQNERDTQSRTNSQTDGEKANRHTESGERQTDKQLTD